jgi:type IV pilus assembly protein PilO
MDLTGGYHDVALFFDRVSKLTRIVNMLNLRMGSATMSKAGNMEIKISCTAMTFAAVEKKPDVAAGPEIKKAK